MCQCMCVLSHSWIRALPWPRSHIKESQQLVKHYQRSEGVEHNYVCQVWPVPHRYHCKCEQSWFIAAVNIQIHKNSFIDKSSKLCINSWYSFDFMTALGTFLVNAHLQAFTHSKWVTRVYISSCLFSITAPLIAIKCVFEHDCVSQPLRNVSCNSAKPQPNSLTQCCLEQTMSAWQPPIPAQQPQEDECHRHAHTPNVQTHSLEKRASINRVWSGSKVITGLVLWLYLAFVY